ncbi:MAG: hypothetical protein LBU80_06660 [Rikenellaceae bacterium]|jgi:diaminopimelate epimerase|nr:hypothetical protein [Rikenellaceae bacterium]
MKTKFFKYHAAGADFLLADRCEIRDPLTVDLVAMLCDRHKGIGAGGMIVLEDASKDAPGAAFYARYYRPDGTEITLPGNAGWCVGLTARHRGIGGDALCFATSSGLREATVIAGDDHRGRVRLSMPDVTVWEFMTRSLIVDLGESHCVEFLKQFSPVEIEKRLGVIRRSEQFSVHGGIVPNFVDLLSDGTLQVQSYDRSAVLPAPVTAESTVACALAANLLCFPDRTTVHLQTVDDRFSVSFEKSAFGRYEKITAEGPAVRIFECEVDTENFQVSDSQFKKNN